MNNLIEDKKPFYKKIWFWVIVILLLVIGAVSQGNNSSNRREKGDTQQTDNKVIEAQKYQIGDKVIVGDLEFIVTKIKSSKSVGPKYLNTTAKGKYLIIDVKVTNKGKDQINLGSSNFKVMNGDMTFEPDTSAAIYLAKKAFVFDNLNPESTMEGRIVFDMADRFIKSKDNKLEVSDGLFDEEALISLK